MANQKPEIPNLNCPVPAPITQGYFTEKQSTTNTARKDRFKIVIDIPKILQSLLLKDDRYCHGGNLERLQFSIWGHVIPETKIATLDKPYAGQNLVFSGLAREKYTPINVKFTVDNRFDNYYIIYRWLDLQNDESLSVFDGKRLGCSNALLPEYTSTITVYGVDEYENEVAKWDYYGAFPTSIGSIDTSSRDGAELESNFTFAFSQIRMGLI